MLDDNKYEWYLGISEDRFKQLYSDQIDISIFQREPESEEDLIDNFLPSKLWRLNNIYSIITELGDKVPFVMNQSQHVVYAASLEHPRLIILKSRQQGISTFWLVSYFDDALTIPNLNIGLMAQGKDEAGTLLDRVKVALNSISPALLNFLQVFQTRDNAGELKFNIGTTIFIRTSFRSATLQRLHVSEYGKIAAENPKRAKETKTGTLQAIHPGMFVIIESTAEGDNDFKKMWDAAIDRETKIKLGVVSGWAGKDFKPVFLSWLYDAKCNSDVDEIATIEQEKYFNVLEAALDLIVTKTQRNFWITEYREIDEAIYQEYPATPKEAFKKSNSGTYYDHQYKEYVVNRNREIVGLFDQNLPVHVAFDLGMDEDDVFTMLFFQRHGKEWRLIYEYTNYGFGFDHYVSHMFDTGYKIQYLICPHDIKVREYGTGAKTREESLRETLTEYYPLDAMPQIMTVDKTGSIATDIEIVRKEIKYIFIDPRNCAYHVKCFKNYSREFDEKLNTWRRKPNHNEYSHGADAIRVMILSGVSDRKRIDQRSEDQRQGVTDGIAL